MSGTRKPLSNQHKEIYRLHEEGKTFEEIAEMLGLHRNTIWRKYQRCLLEQEIEDVYNKAGE